MLAMNTKRLQGIVLGAASRQGWLCHWCDLPIPEDKLTREHLVPRSRGGGSNAANIVAACYDCNHNRANRDSPSPTYILLRRVSYLRANGLYCERPWNVERHREMPGFGRDLEDDLIWAPQYGIVNGPPGLTRRASHQACKPRQDFA